MYLHALPDSTPATRSSKAPFPRSSGIPCSSTPSPLSANFWPRQCELLYQNTKAWVAYEQQRLIAVPEAGSVRRSGCPPGWVLQEISSGCRWLSFHHIITWRKEVKEAAESFCFCKDKTLSPFIKASSSCWESEILNNILETEKELWDWKTKCTTSKKYNYEVCCG